MFDFSDFLFVFIFLTFLPISAGFYLAMASTILVPIYPAVIAGGTLKRNWSSLGIWLGFAVGFTVFTLSINTIVYATYLPAALLRSIAIFLVALFGIAMIFEEKIKINITSNDFVSGLLYGLIIGFIWSTWVGPFMPQLDYYAPKSVDFYLICLTLMFGLGAGLFVLILVYLAQKIIEFMKFPPKKITFIRQILGALMVLIALAIAIKWITIPPREEFIHPEPYTPLHEIFHLKKPTTPPYK